jgi:hypothetical protein
MLLKKNNGNLSKKVHEMQDVFKCRGPEKYGFLKISMMMI